MGIANILIVEDDRAIREMLNFVLSQNNFKITEAQDAESAKRSINDSVPDLVLLDWMLPGLSGIDFAKRLRGSSLTEELPIIMITAKGDELDKVRGLDVGADDYITKPFSPRELIARIRAVLRRGALGPTERIIEYKGLALNPNLFDLQANGRRIELGPTEFKLLHFLMSNPGRVFGREKLLDRVWGVDVYVEERTVDVSVRRLRKSLEPHGFDQSIETIRGVGYRFSSVPQ